MAQIELPATRALVRRPGPEAVSGLTRQRGRTLNPARALQQHQAYVDAMLEADLTVITLPSQTNMPDACFVEDCAVVLGDRALITRPGAPSRREETESVAMALAAWLRLSFMREPAVLDGGDVMRLGRSLYIGQSSRTNAEGIDGLARFARLAGLDKVITVPMPAQELHLKSIVSPLGHDTVLLKEGSLPSTIFEGATLIEVPQEEGYAANALWLGNKKVMLAENAPQTARRLRAAGWEVSVVEASEFRIIDGSLTCLSILF